MTPTLRIPPNDTLEQLAEARDKDRITPTGLVGLEKTFAFNLSGHVLHSIFWQNLSPDDGDRPDGALADASGNSGYMRAVDSVTIRAGATLAMSPQGLDVMVTAREWRAGDLVPFELHFRHSGRVETLAVVVRPGTG